MGRDPRVTSHACPRSRVLDYQRRTTGSRSSGNAQHHEWTEALPELRLTGSTVFNKDLDAVAADVAAMREEGRAPR